jgi:hypothetical protein
MLDGVSLQYGLPAKQPLGSGSLQLQVAKIACNIENLKLKKCGIIFPIYSFYAHSNSRTIECIYILMYPKKKHYRSFESF